MNRLIITTAIFIALSLTACDEKTKVVNVPVPGPAGAVGKTGNDGAQGNQGNQGNQGKTGSQGAEGNKGDKGVSGDTNIIVTPPATPEAPK